MNINKYKHSVGSRAGLADGGANNFNSIMRTENRVIIITWWILIPLGVPLVVIVILKSHQIDAPAPVVALF